MMAANGKVVVAGASGLIGQAAMREFGSSPDWEVVGVSRRQPTGIGSATWWPLDLTDAAACEETLSPLTDVTHVVYAALQEAPGLYEGWLDPAMMQRNGDMLKNFFEPISKVATGLRHVSLLHGTKAYGLHHPSVGTGGGAQSAAGTRSSSGAPELLLDPGGLPAGQAAGRLMGSHRLPSDRRVRGRAGQQHEPDPADRRLRRVVA